MTPRLPKLVFTDIDGVWTDGGMYYDELGNEFKKFNTSDSAGVLFLRRLNIPVCIITGENVQSVSRRAEKLKIKDVFLGTSNKLQKATEFLESQNIQLSECAYIGDDIADLPLLKAVGFSGAPSSAPTYIQKAVQIVTEKKGGDGAFREFVERILAMHGIGEEWLIGA